MNEPNKKIMEKVRRKSMKRLIIISIFFSITLFSVNCAHTPVTVKIGYIPFTANLPFFVAMEKGYFTEQGLRVNAIRYALPNQSFDAMLAKQVDMIAGMTFPLYFASAKETPLRFKLLIPFAEADPEVMSYVLVPKDSKINSVDKLKGKKIGVYEGPTQIFYLKLFLEKIHLNPNKDVTIIQVAPDSQAQALATKQFDALFSSEPYGTITLQKGAAKILVANPRAQYIMSPFWAGACAVSTDFLKQKPAVVKKIYKALAQAIDYIENNEPEAKQMLSKYTPLDETIALKSGIYKWYKINEPIDFASIQQLADFMYDGKLLDKKIDTKGLFLTGQDLQ